MVYFGRIKNGAIVPENGLSLPEGTRVRIEPIQAGDPADDLSAEAVDAGITDMARSLCVGCAKASITGHTQMGFQHFWNLLKRSVPGTYVAVSLSAFSVSG